MKLLKLRFIADVLTCVILALCMTVLPIYIIMTAKFNAALNTKMNNIESMFIKLQNEHNLNAKLIYETLEFRRIEYQCYLTKEAPDFLKIMDTTLLKYAEYISNDKNLSAQEKQQYMVQIEKINTAVDARKKLTDKLIEFDTNKEIYINNLNNNNSQIIISPEFKTILK